MARLGCLGWGFLILVGCSDDGHVVGEMQAQAGSSNATIGASSSGGSATNDVAGSSATSSGTVTSSGAASTGGSGGATNVTTQSSTGSGGGGAATDSGGSAGSDASTDGTSGASGETATTGNSDPCPAGQIWCPGCSPGEGICSQGGCPGVSCPSCTDIATLEECEVEAGCHPVFVEPETCGCLALGCCTRFQFCAPGSKADCEGPATCAAGTSLYCSEPEYVLSYANGCFEGCVRAESCAE